MPLRAFGVLLLGVSWARKRSSTYNRFKGVLDGLGRPLMLMMLTFLGPKKASQAQKHVFTAFSEGFSKAKRMLGMFLGLPNQPH